ncbi:hypothetical protein PTSG_12157 [Salpingoeca rosetta]|uniref:Uncharacterized protein n=1 Tax=Salpingoeca rosetta (strain ATCC 50818 / BSB-021) TaxID=946362 RepID=F2U877_SALR5|nr:uncharacterized protein PTSG_12157 [Salpingoeca rosetta]EGD72585.1 hypothetical protein PTSG_12157 [Salpingoeca rosetta]|eukprot:XP_004994408.1 hypothetical protein PTSG_12157 [Salpingoeca rosetta]
MTTMARSEEWREEAVLRLAVQVRVASSPLTSRSSAVTPCYPNCIPKAVPSTLLIALGEVTV